MSSSKTESVSLHLSGRKHFPSILKCLSTGPTLNEYITEGQLQLLLPRQSTLTISITSVF